MSDYNYYQSEIDSLPKGSLSSLSIQIRSDSETSSTSGHTKWLTKWHTKWLGVNLESIPIIIKKLQQEKRRLSKKGK